MVRWTTSTAGSPSIASKLGYGAGSAAACAFSAARSGLEPTTPVTVDAEPPQRLDVHDADEPRADDGGLQLPDVLHGRPTSPCGCIDSL